MKEVMAMVKAIHSQEVRQAAGKKGADLPGRAKPKNNSAHLVEYYPFPPLSETRGLSHVPNVGAGHNCRHPTSRFCGDLTDCYVTLGGTALCDSLGV